MSGVANNLQKYPMDDLKCNNLTANTLIKSSNIEVSSVAVMPECFEDTYNNLYKMFN